MTLAAYVLLQGGPLSGQAFTTRDWGIRVLASQRSTNEFSPPRPALGYVKSGGVRELPPTKSFAGGPARIWEWVGTDE